jgi:hypothetical protein
MVRLLIFLVIFVYSCQKNEKKYIEVGGKIITRFDYSDNGLKTLIELDSINSIEDTSNYIICTHFPLRDGFEILLIKNEFGFIVNQPYGYFSASREANVIIERMYYSEKKEFYQNIYSGYRFGKDTVVITH